MRSNPTWPLRLLVPQLREQRQQLKSEFGIDLRLLGVASSGKMLLRETGVDLENWREDLDEKVSGWG